MVADWPVRIIFAYFFSRVLTDLNLYNNKIGPEGGVAIGKG